MTKTDVLAARIGGNHVTHLHLLVGDDDPVDQELHELASLREGNFGEAATHSLTELLYGASYSGKLHALVGLYFQLSLLPRRCPLPVLQIPASPLVLGQGDHLPDVSLGQPLKLTLQGSASLAKVLLTGLELLR